MRPRDTVLEGEITSDFPRAKVFAQKISEMAAEKGLSYNEAQIAFDYAKALVADFILTSHEKPE